jgi:hypothetical protein
MRRAVTWIVVPVVGLGSLLVQPASAAGTWTRITSPKGPGQAAFAFVNETANPSPTTSLSGTTSAGVAQVDIYCFWHLDEHMSSNTPLNPAPVSVTGGTFTATNVALPRFSGNETPPCVLRAVPTTYGELGGYDNTGYVGAFTGPTFFGGRFLTHTATPSPDSPVVSWDVYSAHQQAWNLLGGVGNYGFGDGGPADDEADTVGATASDGFVFISRNVLVPSGDTATRSAILVDGKSAFLPAYLAYLSNDPANTRAMTVHAERRSDGNIVVTERNPLSTCSEGYVDAFASCTEQPAGVALVRTTTTSRGGAVVTFVDRFVATDGRHHTLVVEYSNWLFGANYGDDGVKLPGDRYRTPVADTTASTPVLPHTIFTTTDFRAEVGDLHRTDTGITYSGHPRVYFPNDGSFALRYSRDIPAAGFAGFASATETAHSDVEAAPWARERQRALREHLRITAPGRHADVGRVRVKGRVTNPVNGYPGKVTVTVGGKSKQVSVSPSGRWRAVFTLTAGSYKARARTVDPSGIALHARQAFSVR